MLRPSSGFTLIEVLIALVVLAFVATSAQLAIGQYIDQQNHFSTRYKGNWVAWNGAMAVYQQAHWGRGDSTVVVDKKNVFVEEWRITTKRTDTLDNSLQRVEVIAETNADPSTQTSIVLFSVK